LFCVQLGEIEAGDQNAPRVASEIEPTTWLQGPVQVVAPSIAP
jgi:hypothetical protein